MVTPESESSLVHTPFPAAYNSFIAHFGHSLSPTIDYRSPLAKGLRYGGAMTDHFRSPAGAPTTKSGTTAMLRPLGAGETFTLVVARPLLLGRSSDDPGIGRMLAPFPDVSKEHASVTLLEGGSVEIRDHESTYGTWVRGERMTRGSSRRLRLPVEIRLGEDCFLTLVDGPAEPRPVAQ